MRNKSLQNDFSSTFHKPMKVGNYSQLLYKYHIFMYLHTKLCFYCFIDRLPWKELPVQFPERPAHLAVLAVLERRFL